ncbi:MAG: hypothetical protein JST40_11105 [Armatimonadetes bacterium]|nr:hypothetical protein [Armatimonadota bacterium]
MIGSILAAVIAIQPIAAPKSGPVHISLPAQPISKSLPELSKLLGMELRASKSLQNVIVLVESDGKPINEVLDKVADLTQAEWANKETYLELRPSARKYTEARKRAESLRAKRIKAHLDKSYSTEVPAWDSSEYEGMLRKSYSSGENDPVDPKEWRKWEPNARASARLAKFIDIPFLASMNAETRIVFSNHPTQMQRKLEAKVAGILDALQKEQVQAQEIAQKVSGEYEGEEPEPAMTEGDSAPAQAAKESALMQEGPEPISRKQGPVSVVLMIYSVPGELMWSPRTVELRGYDAQGNYVASTTVRANINNPYGGEVEDYEDEVPEDPPVKAPAESTKIKLSPFSEYLMSRISEIMQGGMTISGEVPAEAKKYFDPTVFDPNDSIVADGLRHNAAKVGKNLIAVVPDDAMLLAFTGGEVNINEQWVEKLVSPEGNLIVQQDSDWMTVEPYEPVQDSLFIDRADLKEYLSQVEHDQLGLDELAPRAIATHGKFSFSLYVMYLWITNPAYLMGGMSRNLFDSWLDLYGSLTQGQLDELRQGKSIPIRLLGDETRRQLGRFVYGPEGNLTFNDEADVNNWDPYDVPIPAEVAPDPSKAVVIADAMREPTICLPTGLPGDGYLEGKSSSAKMISTKIRQQNGQDFTYPMGLVQFAQMLNQMETAGNGEITFVEFTPAVEERLSIIYRVAEGVRVVRQFVNPERGERKPVKDWHDLPQAYVTEIEAARAKFRQSEGGNG